MTTGIEDYARWQQMFEGRSGKTIPRSVAGASGRDKSAVPKPGKVVASSMTHPLPGCAVMAKALASQAALCYTCGMAKRHDPRMKQTARPPTGPQKATGPLPKLAALLRELS